ncbi:putative transposon Ty5-1 protein [Phytophthora infestans]|uniref:Putative transposon Ty5-1 protein n=1 Tax=Phytophthora infestans TaxID=4787 RepID=A0A8S9V943_PHYIN|nr:putative transposon Ty5-1 protein [Phytophthora infestans]
MEVNYVENRCLSQKAYIDKVLSRFQMENAKEVRSPPMQNEKVTPIEKDPSKVNAKKIEYQELIGSLQFFVACTRPDIANVVAKTYGLVYQLNDSEKVGTIKVCTYARNFDGVKRFAKKSRKLSELVERGKLSIEYVSTEDIIADMFTKALGIQRFEKLLEKLGVAYF